MFTGIVQGLGEVQSIELKEAIWTLTIVLPNTEGLQRGASVAINGVCLTATDIDESTACFNVIPETLSRSNLSALEVGSTVNVERSLKMGDELGGHLLSGHVMGMGSIVSQTVVGEGMDLVVEAPSTMMKYIHEKGYIGLNGASLTIGEVKGQHFGIHLIPETLALTTFGTCQQGDSINIEIDSMTQTVVATVERMLKQESGGGEA
jgi:riboflavin synthase